MEQLTSFTYENWCLLGNQNGVTSPTHDRTSSKGIKPSQGKLQVFIELMDNLTLADSWRHKNGLARHYTFFSKSHKILLKNQHDMDFQELC